MIYSFSLHFVHFKARDSSRWAWFDSWCVISLMYFAVKSHYTLYSWMLVLCYHRFSLDTFIFEWFSASFTGLCWLFNIISTWSIEKSQLFNYSDVIFTILFIFYHHFTVIWFDSIHYYDYDLLFIIITIHYIFINIPNWVFYYLIWLMLSILFHY